MMQLVDSFSFFMLPPLISLVVAITLAGLSLIKGRVTGESILFALVCIWWALLAPVFISHFFLRGNFDAIMRIERTVHFFYVFIPFINILYFYRLLGLRNNWVTWLFLSFSIGMAILTQTDYYLTGLHEYNWGYIAKGGFALQLFGIYSGAGIVYMFVLFIKRYRQDRNEVRRLKIKYVLLSFLAVMLLTSLNLPAMNGIDFYPMGNFMFIPLAVLAYGVMKHRLMDVRSMLYQTLMWAFLSSLVLIPNIALFVYARPWYSKLDAPFRFMLLVALFGINYYYIRRVQPRIDQIFNRRKYNLYRIEAAFIANVSQLKNLSLLVEEFKRVMKETLNFTHSEVLIKITDEGKYRSAKGEFYLLHPELKDWLISANHLVEIDMVSTNPYYDDIRDKIDAFFESLEASYIIPLVQNDELVGVVALSDKKDYRQLNNHEVNFINNVRTTLAISLSNSVMYQDLSDLKDTLEDKVLSRTEELMAALEKLEEAHRTAEMDLAMAANVQESMLPDEAPSVDGWDVAFYFRPMAGVSGDIYDFYVEDSTLQGCALFDVSGHGIASGLITVIARSIFRRYFCEGKHEHLSTMTRHANRELLGEIGHTDNYLTGVFLRMKDNEVEYVNAGHPDVLLYRAQKKQVRPVCAGNLDCKGHFLGVPDMESPHKALRFTMNQDDMLLLYTDCLNEAVNAKGVEFGDERIAAALQKGPKDSAEAVLQFLVKSLQRFTGSQPLSDDLTIMVLKRTK